MIEWNGQLLGFVVVSCIADSFPKIQENLKTEKSVKEWNDSIRDSISKDLADTIKEKYTIIPEKTGGKLHDLDKMHKFLKDKFNPDNFKSKSAKSSTVSAKAETKTSNKKEKTFGFPKAAISFNIKDIAGECNLTTDGYHIKHPEKTLFLLECKHSKNEIPTQDDIEDALFKL